MKSHNLRPKKFYNIGHRAYGRKLKIDEASRATAEWHLVTTTYLAGGMPETLNNQALLWLVS